MHHTFKLVLLLFELCHFARVGLRKWSFEGDCLVFNVIWRLAWVFGLFSLFLLLALFGFCSLQIFEVFYLFELEYVHESNPGHMGIVCSLVVVRQKARAIIVDEPILHIKGTLDILLEFPVAGAFFIDFAKACLEENL